jgi:thymidylate synthase (FAD)
MNSPIEIYNNDEYVGNRTHMHFKCRVLHHMGDALTVVNAARSSFNKSHEMFEETSDTKLLHYLAKHEHTMPWRHLHIMIQMRVPEVVARQIFRHLVGIEITSVESFKDVAWSEMSGRYVAYNETYIPENFHHQHQSRKQGASDIVHEKSKLFYDKSSALIEQLMLLYNEMINDGIAREEARCILPMGLYTEFSWTPSLLALAHFVRLRSKVEAQAEIRDVADVIHNFAVNRFGIAYTILYSYMDKEQ